MKHFENRINMKRYVMAAMSLLLGMSVSAQTIDWGASATNVVKDSIEKKVQDKAQYVAVYDYKYARNAKYPNEKRQGITVLQIGDRYNRFCDYYDLCFDSICDSGVREKKTLADVTPKMMAALRNSKFTESIVVDKKQSKATVQRTAGLKNKTYEYEENCPEMAWELLDGDTIILGYHCNKAQTSYAGRDYIAWYTPELNLPYGPYKFGKLPGLILKVTDTKDNFDFEMTGFRKVSSFTPIYKWSSKDIEKTTRGRVRKIYKNFCADPVGALTSNDDIEISEDVKATVNAKPYNPIELE